MAPGQTESLVIMLHATLSLEAVAVMGCPVEVVIVVGSPASANSK